MSEEIQRRAFEPFFTTRRSRGGTGLGLHIVYNLVTRRLGGRLRLEFGPGPRHHLPIRLPLVGAAGTSRPTARGPHHWRNPT